MVSMLFVVMVSWVLIVELASIALLALIFSTYFFPSASISCHGRISYFNTIWASGKRQGEQDHPV